MLLIIVIYQKKKKEEAKGKIDDAVQQAQDNNSNPATIIALILIGYGLYKFARYIFSDKKKRKYRRTYYDDD